jgi:CubicO group peptidase (beta-lactamase class C family)
MLRFKINRVLLTLCLAPRTLVCQMTDGVVSAPNNSPTFSPTGPNAAEHGEAQKYPIGTRETMDQPEYLVGSYSHFDTIFPAKAVPRPDKAWTFQRSPHEPDIHYYYHGEQFSLEDYLARGSLTGILIARDDTILSEHYQYGRTDRDRFTSHSMVKTIVSMLFGIAISEGRIRSIDDLAAAYVPELKGSEYGKTPIRDLLHMSSGIALDQSGDLADVLSWGVKNDGEMVARIDKRAASPGTRFSYNGIDTEVLALILHNVTDCSLSDYLSEKIWKPIGAESDASWIIDSSGQEVAYFGFNAVLRDYARLGRLLAWDGCWQGNQLIPKQWIVDATTNRDSDPQLAPGAATPFLGYGYQVWILPGSRRMFALLGAHGQYIFVDPASKLIMVQTAVRPKPINPEDAETVHLWLTIVKQLGGN